MRWISGGGGGGGEGRCGGYRLRAISGHNTRSENGRFASIRE